MKSLPMTKQEQEVLGRMAEAMASAVTVYGSVLGAIVVCRDLLSKGSEKGGDLRSASRDSATILGWLAKTVEAARRSR